MSAASTDTLLWLTGRATGIVAWFLLSASMLWGIVIVSRSPRRRAAGGVRQSAPRAKRRGPHPAWVLDFHRFVSGLAVVFTVVHIVVLVLDPRSQLSWLATVVPFTSSVHTWATTLGVVATELLIAVELTSLLRRFVPRRAWRMVHATSYLAFVAASCHFVAVGTDAVRSPLTVTAAAVALFVGAATVWRIGVVLYGRRRSGADTRTANAPASASASAPTMRQARRSSAFSVRLDAQAPIPQAPIPQAPIPQAPIPQAPVPQTHPVQVAASAADLVGVGRPGR